MTLTTRILRVFPRIFRFLFSTVDLPRQFGGFADCGCSVGSSWNVSCSDDCAGGKGCSTTEDGCGFLGFYACDGGCTPKAD
jgi:hypothetical protein